LERGFPQEGLVSWPIHALANLFPALYTIAYATRKA